MFALSVKAKVTIWFSALMLLITAAALGFIIELGGSMLEGSAMERLARAVNRNAEYVEYDDNDGIIELDIDEEFEPYSFGTYCIVYSLDGTPVAGEMPEGFPDAGPLAEGPPRTVENEAGSFYIYDRYADNGRLWVRGVKPANDAESVPLRLARFAFLLLPVLVLAGAAGGYAITRRAFRPIDRIIASVNAINEGHDLSARIGLPHKNDEIHRIASAFDKMLARLENSFEAEKQFASDASHELRTPTAVILAQCAALEKEGLSEADYKNGVAAIERQAQKMSRLINLLLSITRLEQGTAKADFERADLSELVSVICREMSSIRDGAELTADIEKDVYAEMDVALMSRLIENLLENAFKYGGGKVEVRLRRENGKAKLSISDNGPGIRPAELPKIWRRFYRADKSRSSGGLGLGLALVKQIAGIHNARVTAESEPGRGTTFTMTIAEK